MLINPKAIIVATGLALVTMQACSQKAGSSKTEKLPSGVEYQLVKDEKGTNIKAGDIVSLHVSYFVPGKTKDSLLQTTHAMSKEPFKITYQPPAMAGAWEEALTKASAGDSLIVYMPTDSIFKGEREAQRPPFLKKGSKVKVGVMVASVDNAANLTAGEKKTLKDWAAKNKPGKIEELPSGLMYIVTQEGKGPKPVAGNTVEVHYTGTLLDGTKFDSSVDRGQPFSFTIGQGQVIKGWDEGIAALNEGSKAILLIPSELAYGANGAPGAIPPFSPLVFEVELIKAKK